VKKQVDITFHLAPLNKKVVEGIWIVGKKACKFSEKSAKTSTLTLSPHDKIKGFMSTIFKVQSPLRHFLFTSKSIEILKNPLVFFYQPQRIKRGSVAQSG